MYEGYIRIYEGCKVSVTVAWRNRRTLEMELVRVHRIYLGSFRVLRVHMA